MQTQNITLVDLLVDDPNRLVAEEVNRLNLYLSKLELVVKILQLSQKRESLVACVIAKESVFNIAKPLLNKYFIHKVKFNNQPFMLAVCFYYINI